MRNKNEKKKPIFHRAVGQENPEAGSTETMQYVYYLSSNAHKNRLTFL